MDGTILDSMGHWRNISVEFLKKRNLPVPPEMEPLITNSAAAARLFVEKFDLGMTFEEVIQEFENDMDPLYQTVIQAKPGVIPCLQAMREAGMKLSVATATPQVVAEEALRHHGLLDYFEFVVCATDLGINKSNPEFFRIVAGRMGMEAEACVVFEDAVYAMRGAKAAGCAVVAIEDDSARDDLAEIREICDLYLPDYNLFTMKALEQLDKPVTGAV